MDRGDITHLVRNPCPDDLPSGVYVSRKQLRVDTAVFMYTASITVVFGWPRQEARSEGQPVEGMTCSDGQWRRVSRHSRCTMATCIDRCLLEPMRSLMDTDILLVAPDCGQHDRSHYPRGHHSKNRWFVLKETACVIYGLTEEYSEEWT